GVARPYLFPDIARATCYRPNRSLVRVFPAALRGVSDATSARQRHEREADGGAEKGGALACLAIHNGDERRKSAGRRGVPERVSGPGFRRPREEGTPEGASALARPGS